MSKPKQIIVKETVSVLRKQLKKTSELLRPRLLMLLEQKKHESEGISKRELADLIGVNHNSIQNWRNLYGSGGFQKLISHNKIGFKRSVIRKIEHEGLKNILTNPLNGIQGYKELNYWFENTYNRKLAYTTLTGYCIRNFSTKIKVARKSHVKKDAQAGEAFKKTLTMT